MSQDRWFKAAVWVGLVLRLGLLGLVLKTGGYRSGDTKNYELLGDMISAGQYSSVEFFYPPGLPAILALIKSLTGSIVPLLILQIILTPLLQLLVGNLVSKRGSPEWAAPVAWFLALDPIWLTNSLIVAADFLGALIFGLAISLTLNEFAEERRGLLFWMGIGLLSGVAVLFKSVYFFFPPLFVLGCLIWRRSGFRRPVFFLLGLILTFGVYIIPRSMHLGEFSVSGHDHKLFGRYIVGSMWTAEGRFPDIYTAMDAAVTSVLAVDTEQTRASWSALVRKTVLANPVAFLKVCFVSVYKTVFGHANVTFGLFFTGTEISGPGLWTSFAGGSGLAEKLAGLSWDWLGGLLICFLEKLALLFLAVRGTVYALRNQNQALSNSALALSWVMVFYFAVSPVVFGEPRYFLPATILLLFLSALGPVPDFSRKTL